MLVIADASPLHYRILLESTDILPVLFGRIVIPRAVAEELQHWQTPAVVRVWMATPPAWLSIQDVSTASEGKLAHLDPGEEEVIRLAQALHADLVLMDEWEGRREAVRRALTVTGVLGVLERAAQQELLDLPSTVRAAEILRVRRATLSDLIHGKASLSPEMASQIEKPLMCPWPCCCGCRHGMTATPCASGQAQLKSSATNRSESSSHPCASPIETL